MLNCSVLVTYELAIACTVHGSYIADDIHLEGLSAWTRCYIV